MRFRLISGATIASRSGVNEKGVAAGGDLPGDRRRGLLSAAARNSSLIARSRVAFDVRLLADSHLDTTKPASAYVGDGLLVSRAIPARTLRPSPRR